MIRVTVELLPGGDESDAQVIAMAGIANTGTKSGPCDYIAVLVDAWQERSGLVADHNGSHGVWALIARAASIPNDPDLDSAIPEALRRRLPWRRDSTSEGTGDSG